MHSKETEARFFIKYDGPALETHTINARDLGIALLAISDLCQAANWTLTGKNARVNVQVEVTGEGCYEIVFKLIQAVTPALLEAGRPSAKELLELLGLYASPGVVGLLGFSKWRKGRPIINQEASTSRDGNTYVKIFILGHNNKVESINIDNRVFNLANDYSVRAAQKDLVSPLRPDFITKFSSRGEENQTPIEVAEDEVANGYFDLEEIDLENPIPEIETTLTLRAPVFKIGAKWQFFLEGGFVHASILDEKFNDKVFKKSERFGAGDQFKVKLRITPTLSSRGTIKNIYEIIEVIEEIPGPKPQELPLNNK